MRRYPDNRLVEYQGMYPYQMPQQPIQILAYTVPNPYNHNGQTCCGNCN